MGHRHTSEEQSVACAVCSNDGGSAAAAGQRSGSREATIVVSHGISAECRSEDHRLKPEPPALKPMPSALKPVPLGVRLALFALRFYKSYLSLLFAGSCRFEPTCSRYAYEAVERFGVVRGSWLTLRRLLRCQPFSRSFGYDPVPEAWEAVASSDPPVPEVDHPVGVRQEVRP
jgi:uncharacterized protein